MESFTPEQLREQERVIIHVLETGGAEELAKLKLAEDDPAMHPEIKALISKCRAYVLNKGMMGNLMGPDIHGDAARSYAANHSFDKLNQ